MQHQCQVAGAASVPGAAVGNLQRPSHAQSVEEAVPPTKSCSGVRRALSLLSRGTTCSTACSPSGAPSSTSATIDAMLKEFSDASEVQCRAILNLAKEHSARYGLNTIKPSNTGLVSAVETRFASHVSLAHNRPVLQLLAACYPEHFSNQQQARQFIGDNQRWELLDSMLAMLQPIRDAIKALEGDGTAYPYWLVIMARLHAHVTSGAMSAELREHIIIKWANRYWEQLPHDLMASALLLHPRLRDNVPLSAESKKRACIFVHNYILEMQQGRPGRKKTAEACMDAMDDYLMRRGQFDRPPPAQGQSDIEWWRR